jgi:K(+)-stimulated pyrophosphate-energized sodium pump
MLLPGLITIVTPVIIGLLMGPEALGSYMAGVAVSGVLWAIFQNNAGGAWDNAKKSFEAGVEINGKMEKKGSDAHKAAVTGDTVGDPFKDTSGPSMNILIKLTCLVGLVIAPILGDGHGVQAHQVEEQQKEIRVEVTNSTEGETIATITTITSKNGQTSETIQEIVGSQEMIDSTLLEIKGQKKE